MKILKEITLYDFQVESLEKLKKFHEVNPSGCGYLHIATGGGKTVVTNHYIIEHWLKKGKRVLWLAPDWTLLEQAYSSFINDFSHDAIASFQPTYICGSKSPSKIFSKNLPLLDDIHKDKVSITYSTLQTFSNWELYKHQRPHLIVFDEAHWGKGGVTEEEVNDLSNRHSIPILGLSGTPKRRKGWDIIDSVPFQSLVGKYLATPVFQSVSTGISIDATASSAKERFNQIQNVVYEGLGKNKKRNELIVNTYDREKHGKTIVYAIDIDQANKLCDLFQKRGINTYPIHSRVSDAREAITEFRENSSFHVAITVNMLNQGIDVPSVKTLFITRPVTSDILYSQMVGRGARLHPETNKKNFLVVDFEDNFVDPELQRMIFEPKCEYFGSQAKSSIYSSAYERINLENHPKPEIKFPMHFQDFVFDSWDNYVFKDNGKEIQLPILERETFGVEIELTTRTGFEYVEDRKNWNSVTDSLYDVMKRILPPHLLGIKGKWKGHLVDLDYTKFNLIYDGSCGWEIVTCVLKGKEGFYILDDFLKKLSQELTAITPRLDVNHSTGLHVHFGFRLPDNKVNQIVKRLWEIEPYVGCLVPPSRFNDYDVLTNTYDSECVNQYCEPLRERIDWEDVRKLKTTKKLAEILNDDEADDEGEIFRYLTVNFKNLLEGNSTNTLEIRMHSGSYDSKKILSWISLWMGILGQVWKEEVNFPEADIDIMAPEPHTFKEFHAYIKKILPKTYDEMMTSIILPRLDEIKKLWEQYIFTDNLDAE